MTKYIQDTIEAIDLKVLQLQSIKRALEQFFKDWTIEADPGPAPIAPARPPTPRLVKPVRAVSPARPQPKANRQSKPAGHTAPETLQVAALVADLPEPFTAPDVSRVAKIDSKRGQNFITQSFVKGWITRLEQGRYSKTKAFPQPTSIKAAAPVTAPKPAGTRAELEAKLAAALKQRDHANANGREQIAEIYQKEIEQLETQLGI